MRGNLIPSPLLKVALLFRSPSLCGGGLRGWVLFSVIASGFVKSAWQSRHFLSLRAVLLARRGNLIRIANDLQNAQLVKTRDCHDFANAKSRNDGVICRPEVCNASRSISKAIQNRDFLLSCLRLATA